MHKLFNCFQAFDTTHPTVAYTVTFTFNTGAALRVANRDESVLLWHDMFERKVFPPKIKIKHVRKARDISWK